MAMVGSDADAVVMANARHGSIPEAILEKEAPLVSSSSPSDLGQDGREPTEAEIHTLSRVAGKIPWVAYTVAFVELCERFAYYGTTVVWTNFIQWDLPSGSSTGSAPNGQPGALGMGQRASFGLTTLNSFWSYVTPLLGAYIADEYLGRFKTIQISIGFCLTGHILMIICAIPSVVSHGDRAFPFFIIGLVIMGLGTGGFKANISPLIAEQYKGTRMAIKTLPSGEKVIVDPVVTYQRIYNYFYMLINVGSLTGQISMVYAEKYVGFWLSYTLPTILYCFCPLVLFACRNKYNRTPPAGSSLMRAFKLYFLSMKDRWSLNPVTTLNAMRDPELFSKVKSSRLGERKPEWMTFDDAWVDECDRGFSACRVFWLYPIYWLSYNQITSNLTSQAAQMKLNGVPNDLINNLNPISLVIFIPIVDLFIYPALRKAGYNFSAVKRITVGFFLGCIAMIAACVTQHYIYITNPCGDHVNTCIADGRPGSSINVWVQTLPYVLIGLSEIMASITGLEYAFTKAPANMKSLVTGFFFLQQAFSSAVAQALVSLSEDPLLVWLYGVVAVLAFIGGCLMWIFFRKLDAAEDELNNLQKGLYVGKVKADSLESGKMEEESQVVGEKQ